MTVTKPPFESKSAQACITAIPYQKIMIRCLFWARQSDVRSVDQNTASRGRSRPNTSLTAKATALLTEAGYPDGFGDHALVRSNFSRCHEPSDPGVHESLARSAIKTTSTVPAPTVRTDLNKKGNAAYTNRVLGLARLPRILLYWCVTAHSRLQSMSYKSPR